MSKHNYSRNEFIRVGTIAWAVFTIPFHSIAFSKYNEMMEKNNFDVIVVGGSYAGLSAAMALGRSLRKVLIIDAGESCNRFTPHSHNFITHDGAKPGVISKKAKAEVLKYDTVSFLKNIAIAGTKTATGFLIRTQDGNEFHAKKIIFATGIKDSMPDIKGFAACWGKTIIHCPYCHGYEFKGKKTGIMADGARGFHLASMVNNLTDSLTIMTNGKADFTEEQTEKLKKNKIEIVETALLEIEHEGGKIENVIFTDGTKKRFDALYAALAFTQQSEIPASLGCEFTEQGFIKVNLMHETIIAGVFACGDNANMMRSVALAVSSGNIAGVVVNGRFVEENF